MCVSVYSVLYRKVPSTSTYQSNKLLLDTTHTWALYPTAQLSPSPSFCHTNLVDKHQNHVQVLFVALHNLIYLVGNLTLAPLRILRNGKERGKENKRKQTPLHD